MFTCICVNVFKRKRGWRLVWFSLNDTVPLLNGILPTQMVYPIHSHYSHPMSIPVVSRPCPATAKLKTKDGRGSRATNECKAI